MDQHRITYLYHRYLDKTCTAAERIEFFALLADPVQAELLFAPDKTDPIPDEKLLHLENSVSADILYAILKIDRKSKPADEDSTADISPPQSPNRIRFLKTAWFRYAAVLLIIAGTATFLYLNNQPKKQIVVIQPTSTPDILPGGNKAVLTLADGTAIPLDSVANGAIAQQGNASINKLANGEVRYDLKGASRGEAMMNSMSTPRGGQYQLTLPDGTKVWLNAASSITYPAAFAGKDRKVKVTGEVYMEVAHNKAKPFLVDVDGKSTLQVLGTSFNINAYGDEGTIRTTLIEGSLNVDQKAVLKPGQQAVQTLPTTTGNALVGASPANKFDRQPDNTAGIIVRSNVDLSQTLAWKNGIFNFQDTDLKTLMRQIERWYDVDVKYIGNVPAFKFKGEMDRGVKLTGLMRFLQQDHVQMRLEGRTLIIETK